MDVNDVFVYRLWHQLTLALDEFLSDQKNKRGYNFKELYIDFISKFETRLNPIRLAQLLAKIGLALDSAQDAVDFFSTFTGPKSKLSAEAVMCLEMDINRARLKLGQVDQVKASLEQTTAALKTTVVTEPVIFSKFYKASAEYAKVRHDRTIDDI